MSKHTPGPWEADMFPDTQGYKIRAGGRVLAIVKTADSSPAMEPQMNRHLIGAAPEILEALEGLLQAFEEALVDEWSEPREVWADGDAWHSDWHAKGLKAIAAIAKARGEE